MCFYSDSISQEGYKHCHVATDHLIHAGLYICVFYSLWSGKDRGISLIHIH